ncbi:MAG: hypothetical protein WCJ14_10860 [Verrucomicrobiota bacterium]
MTPKSRACRSALLGSLLATVPPAEARTWTDTLGRTFEADFIRLDGSNVILALANGRAFATPIAGLSAGDQNALRSAAPGALRGSTPAAVPGAAATSAPAGAPAVTTTLGRSWPAEIRLPGPVPSKVVAEDPKSRRFVYESPDYRFTCDARITDDALRNFAVMFEATRAYALSLPLGLGGGRERQGKLDILLFGSMTDYIRAGGPPNSAGCFTRGVVLTPMESLGLVEGGTGFSLDAQRHNHVLIHELVHQLTPDAYMAPGALGWFSEGLAEYMAITPYNWGYFRPDVHGNVVKTYVTTGGSDGIAGRSLGNRLLAPKLRDLLLMPYSRYSGGNANFNYGLGLLVTHYFFHMEGSGKAFRITRFLQGLQAGQRGEAALAPLLGGGSYDKLESEITAAWARMGLDIHFGG